MGDQNKGGTSMEKDKVQEMPQKNDETNKVDQNNPNKNSTDKSKQ